MSNQDYLDLYRDTRVSTVSPERLIVLLYEGALRFIGEAEAALEAGDVPRRGNAVNRAVRIVQELDNSLDHEKGPHIAPQLSALYEFVEHQLGLAHVEGDPRHLRPAAQVLTTLLGSWRRIADGLVDDATAPAPSAPAEPPRPGLSVAV